MVFILDKPTSLSFEVQLPPLSLIILLDYNFKVVCSNFNALSSNSWIDETIVDQLYLF